MLHLALVLALALHAPNIAQPLTPPLSASPALQGSWRTGRSPALLAILDEHFEWSLREDPLSASARGDRRYNALLRDDSPAATARRTAELADRLARLDTLLTGKDAAAWSDADRTDADLLHYELTLDTAGARFHNEQTPIDQRSGSQIWFPQMADSLAFTTPQDYADYASRLEAIPAAIDASIDQMRLGLAAGRVPPKPTVSGTAEQAAAMASTDFEATPSLSPFFKPFRSLPPSDPSAARARDAITAGIIPAYRRLAAFLRNEYIPQARESTAISAGIDGPAAYDHALRRHTTTSLTADKVHTLGLAEVARLRAHMLKVITRTDYPGKSSSSGDDLFTAFVAYLRTDPRFYVDTPDALLAGYRDIAKKVDPALPRLFGTLPRTPYGVRQLPAFAAPTSPTAYYYHGSLELGLPGFFMANTYRLDQRPRYEMAALTLHEACPGHHTQIALAQELEGVHPFRTLSSFTAFSEGWALYAERLGLEIAPDGSGELVPGPAAIDDPGTGLYSDPYDDFGRLTYEMWRACRLVVDTGLHAKEWTRRQAIDYMLANTALSPHNIEREVDRYIAWPGQACAYKIGQLKISELRGRAERALGPSFDIRAFHDTVLGAGALPLPALEARVTRWIDARVAR